MFCRAFAVILVALTVLLSGCATPTKMAFSDPTDPESQKITKPVFLMTATLRNKYVSVFQPKLLFTSVERAVVKGAADRLNFRVDDLGSIESRSIEAGNTYLIRMELEQGDYVLRGLTSLARSFPIQAMFFTPVHENIKSSNPGVFYLGHVEATVRERKDNEFKAGPSIPLIDQGVAGASSGTFDVVISDRWEEDEQKFRSRFPALKGVTVEKKLLPPFDRARAQKWWEEN